MPVKIAWTEAQDLKIKRLRAERASWETIAAEAGVSVWAAVDRARRIGARPPPPDYLPPPEDPEREAYPAGHPSCWTPIVAGTLLDGVPYPLPVFWR